MNATSTKDCNKINNCRILWIGSLSQRGWSVQGWESVCWGVLGISLFEKVYWFLGFMVLWFLVSRFVFLVMHNFPGEEGQLERTGSFWDQLEFPENVFWSGHIPPGESEFTSLVGSTGIPGTGLYKLFSFHLAWVFWLFHFACIYVYRLEGGPHQQPIAAGSVWI